MPVCVDDDRLWPDMASGSVIRQLDALFGILAVLTWIHACSFRGWGKGTALVLFLAFHTALFEHTSLFLGGTHCHATSSVLPMITPCSSINSVLFYVPWIYTSLESARRLLASGKIHILAVPFAVGLLQFGFGVVYEMQGPMNHFWHWPGADGIIAASSKCLGPWEGYPGIEALADAQTKHEVATIDASGVFSVSSHAGVALEERLFEFPILAPYFHFAYGFAWATCLLVVQKLTSRNPSDLPSLSSIVVSGLHSTFFFIVPIEATRTLTATLGVSYRVGAPISLGLSLLPIFLLKPSSYQKPSPADNNDNNKSKSQYYNGNDMVLFYVSFVMHVFFVSFPWRSPNPTPRELSILVTTIATLHLMAQWYCCFAITMPTLEHSVPKYAYRPTPQFQKIYKHHY